MEPCTKRGYDKKTALTLKNMAWRDGRGAMRVYHCPVCGAWHLTHLPDTRMEKRKQQ